MLAHDPAAAASGVVSRRLRRPRGTGVRVRSADLGARAVQRHEGFRPTRAVCDSNGPQRRPRTHHDRRHVLRPARRPTMADRQQPGRLSLTGPHGRGGARTGGTRAPTTEDGEPLGPSPCVPPAGVDRNSEGPVLTGPSSHPGTCKFFPRRTITRFLVICGVAGLKVSPVWKGGFPRPTRGAREKPCKSDTSSSPRFPARFPRASAKGSPSCIQPSGEGGRTFAA